MDERKLLIYLQTISGVGSKTISRLINNLSSLSSIFTMQPLELSMKGEIDFAIAEKLVVGCNNTAIEQFKVKFNSWINKGIEIVTIFDEEYPYLLKEIPNPPLVLYCLGNKKLMQMPAIAIVGTRNPTNYGKVAAELLAKELVEYGLTIISGLAKGIDRVAHEGALKGQGNTVAVLGCGVDIIYPLENSKLYQDIIKSGLVISEYPPGTKAHPGFFPQRNRIISGLAYGTIVIEASIKSGSLITAQCALEQAREVFAVPGSIVSKQSLGTNSLIQQGAKLIQCGKDIADELPYLALSKKIFDNQEQALNETEKSIYALINFQPIHIDELYDKLSLNLSMLYEVLFSLQIKGMIKQLSGGVYIREV